MRWSDIGIVLSAQKYTDKKIIVSVLTRDHGRRCGIISKNQNMAQIGNMLSLEWSGRLESNLGYFKCELMNSVLQYCLADPLKTLSIASLTAILAKALPENESHTELFFGFNNLIIILKYSKSWQQQYIANELQLLARTGFALSLHKCTRYHTTDNLKFISPKTGAAVSEAAAKGYENSLLPLTSMLLNAYNDAPSEDYSLQEFSLSLKVLWYFLKKNLLIDLHCKTSQYRIMLMQHINRVIQATHLVSDG